jgi:hypothetical protein
MNRLPEQWLSRPILSSAGFFGLVLTFALYANSYLSMNADLQNQFLTKSRLLEGLNRQTAANPDAPKEGGKNSRAEAISAATGTLAASEIQNTMVDLIEQAGGVLHSIQAQVTTDDGGEGLKRLKTQVIFDASNEALQKVLFKLETAKPYSFIDSLVVQPSQSVGSAQPGWEILRITLDASSYWRVEGRPDEPPTAAIR